MQIDLSIMLKMNNKIANLSKELSMIHHDLSSVLSKREDSIPKTLQKEKLVMKRQTYLHLQNRSVLAPKNQRKKYYKRNDSMHALIL